MKKVMYFLFLLPSFCMGISYDSIPMKKKIFHINVKDLSLKSSEGYLQNMDDTALFLAARPVMFAAHASSEKIHYTTISNLTIKRKGSAGRGALYGAASGIVLGALIGLISGDDKPEADGGFLNSANWFKYTAAEKATAYAAMLGTTGAVVGVLVGALAKKKFTIGGNRKNFNDMQKHTLDRLYRSQRNL